MSDKVSLSSGNFHLVIFYGQDNTSIELYPACIEKVNKKTVKVYLLKHKEHKTFVTLYLPKDEPTLYTLPIEAVCPKMIPWDDRKNHLRKKGTVYYIISQLRWNDENSTPYKQYTSLEAFQGKPRRNLFVPITPY